jgi:hypothetical protein
MGVKPQQKTSSPVISLGLIKSHKGLFPLVFPDQSLRNFTAKGRTIPIATARKPTIGGANHLTVRIIQVIELVAAVGGNVVISLAIYLPFPNGSGGIPHRLAFNLPDLSFHTARDFLLQLELFARRESQGREEECAYG